MYVTYFIPYLAPSVENKDSMQSVFVRANEQDTAEQRHQFRDIDDLSDMHYRGDKEVGYLCIGLLMVVEVEVVIEVVLVVAPVVVVVVVIVLVVVVVVMAV